MKFSISEKEGKNFAKLSGDKNKIHLDELYGYNSAFNSKICHGCLILIKFLKLIGIEKLVSKYENYNISINFIRHFIYKNEISVVKKKNNFILRQNNEICAKIDIVNKFLPTDESLNLKRIDKKKLAKNDNPKKINNIIVVLCHLSKYVGMIYPGENSLIKNISLNFKKKNKILKQ